MTQFPKIAILFQHIVIHDQPPKRLSSDYERDIVSKENEKREKQRAANRRWFRKNREKRIAQIRAYARTDQGRKIKRLSSKNWRLRHPERRLAYLAKPEVQKRASDYQRAWSLANRDKCREKSKRYRARHKETVAIKIKEYRIKNADKVREWRRANHRKYESTPFGKIHKRLRARLRDELRFRHRKTRKFCSAIDLVGCTRQELVSYIEKLFKPGMTWENSKLWHIDHIRPVCLFNLLDLEEQRRCFHFSNLQPLWAHENLSKSKKTDPLAIAA